MKIAVTSDLHGYLPDIEECDILCICGDICPASDHSKGFQESWIKDEFISWVKDVPAKSIVFVAGNHDFYFENKSQGDFEYFPDKLYYLCNESIDLFYEDRAIKIFGTPYCKRFGNWAFMKDYLFLINRYNEIPEKCDIVLSHDAPNIAGLGTILDEDFYACGENVGNSWLADAILQKRPLYAFCGHIHSGQHEMQRIDDTQMANVSLCNEFYQPVNKVLYVEI